MDIVKHLMDVSHYNPTETKKTQIVVHHTAGSSNPINVITGWEATTTRVGAHFVIGGISTKGDASFDGKVYQAVDTKYWLWHLGITGASSYKHGVIDSQSIGIEICNYGWLIQSNGVYKTYVGNTVPPEQVVDLGSNWRGYRYWHKYSDAQLVALTQLVTELSALHEIPKTHRVFSLADFENNIDGFATKPLAFHANYRFDKFDCAPQSNLISALNALYA